MTCTIHVTITNTPLARTQVKVDITRLHAHTHTTRARTHARTHTHTPLVRAQVEVDGDLDLQESIIFSLTQFEKLVSLELTYRLVTEVLQQVTRMIIINHLRGGGDYTLCITSAKHTTRSYTDLLLNISPMNYNKSRYS